MVGTSIEKPGVRLGPEPQGHDRDGPELTSHGRPGSGLWHGCTPKQHGQLVTMARRNLWICCKLSDFQKHVSVFLPPNRIVSHRKKVVVTCSSLGLASVNTCHFSLPNLCVSSIAVLRWFHQNHPKTCFFHNKTPHSSAYFSVRFRVAGWLAGWLVDQSSGCGASTSVRAFDGPSFHEALRVFGAEMMRNT